MEHGGQRRVIAAWRVKDWMVFVLLFTAFLNVGTIYFQALYQPRFNPGDHFIWESVSHPDSLDPHINYESYGTWILYNIYETLYTYPWNTSRVEPLVPLLAAEMPSISPDGVNYTIRLRQGVTFHDGTSFNASSVKWNIERAMKISYLNGPVSMLAEVLKGGRDVIEVAALNGTSSAAFKAAFDNWVENSSSIEIIDTYEVRFILEFAYSPFIQFLAHPVFSMMSPTYVLSSPNNDTGPMGSHWGADYGETHTWMEDHTCGTGPYVLEEWRQPDYPIILDFFEDYWRADVTEAVIAPPDYAGTIKTIVFRTTEDTTLRLLHLRGGSADGVDWPTANVGEIWDNVTLGSKAPNIYVSTDDLSFDVFFLGFNLGNLTTIVDSSTVTVHSPFENRNLRRAASFAFNYERFIDSRLNGFGIQAKGPIPEGMPSHNVSAFTFEFNITEAVDEWNLAMQDPQLVASLNSLNNKLTLYHIASSAVPAEMLLIQGLEQMYAHPDANHVGLTNDMTFELEPLAPSIYWDYLEEDRLPVVSTGWSPDIAHPADSVRPFCYHMGEWAQEIGYNNTDVNNWYDLALMETDPLEQRRYYNLIQEAVAHDVPFLWASQFTELLTWRTWLEGRGLTYNPMHGIYVFEIYETSDLLADELYTQRTLSWTLEGLLFVTLFFYLVFAWFGTMVDTTKLRVVVLAIYSALVVGRAAVIFNLDALEAMYYLYAPDPWGAMIPFLIGYSFLAVLMCFDIYMKEDTYWAKVLLVSVLLLLVMSLTITRI